MLCLLFHVLLGADDLQAALGFAVYLVVHAPAGHTTTTPGFVGVLLLASHQLLTGPSPYDAC